MFVARLLPVLPDLLTSTQLCSVAGRSIFDGGLSILSSILYLRQRRLPGFLVSLDLFHAYDRVDLRWVEAVLEAMGFGPTFRGWIQTLHRGAAACFMLHSLTLDLLILFSIRQGDPLAMLLFIIQIEPLLRRLQQDLTGLNVGLAHEASLGYVDDVAALGTDEADLLKLDEAVRDFEAVSGAILNRNRKSVIVGLGEWEGRADWPLPWIHTAPNVKVYGFLFSASFDNTVRLSWDRVITGFEATLRRWGGRHVPTLAARRLALETYGLSKLWYFAQLLPLPRAALLRIQRAVSTFLWAGRLERLAMPELCAPRQKGGLALTCVASRALALRAKQVCHQLAAGGRARAHLAYWLGLQLRGALPLLGRGPHTEAVPPQMRALGTSLLEIFALPSVNISNLAAATAKNIYLDLTDAPPSPKVEAKFPDLVWPRIWPRLTTAGLPPSLVDVGFSALHNVLPLQSRRHRLGLAPTPACPRCGAASETVLHFFTQCPRVRDAWDCLFFAAARALGGPLPDLHLLFLHFPLHYPHENAIVLAVLAHMELVWLRRDVDGPIAPAVLKARVNFLAHGPVRSLFSL
jgi:hypothetical protein